MFSPQEDPTGQKYGRLEEEGGMGPDKVASNIIMNTNFISKHFTLLLSPILFLLLLFSTERNLPSFILSSFILASFRCGRLSLYSQQA